MKAAEDGDEGIVSQLLPQSVDMDAVNNKGRTAMSFAATPSNRAWPSMIGVLRLLLTIGADFSILDDGGYTAESRVRKEER
jgi:ankyrin repeat protein